MYGAGTSRRMVLPAQIGAVCEYIYWHAVCEYIYSHIVDIPARGAGSIASIQSEYTYEYIYSHTAYVYILRCYRRELALYASIYILVYILAMYGCADRLTTEIVRLSGDCEAVYM
jgi:hypothetical protein